MEPTGTRQDPPRDIAAPEGTTAPSLPWSSGPRVAPWLAGLDEMGPKAAAALRAYLDMPAATRSLARLSREQHFALDSLKEWSATWNWQARCRQFQEAVDGRRRARMQERLDRAVDERTKAILGGVAAIAEGVKRILRDLRDDHEYRLTAQDTKFLAWALSELRLERGEATSHDVVELAGARERLTEMISKYARRQSSLDDGEVEMAPVPQGPPLPALPAGNEGPQVIEVPANFPGDRTVYMPAESLGRRSHAEREDAVDDHPYA